jgi:hypothetical protein
MAPSMCAAPGLGPNAAKGGVGSGGGGGGVGSIAPRELHFIPGFRPRVMQADAQVGGAGEHGLRRPRVGLLLA